MQYLSFCISAAAPVASVMSDSVQPHRWQPTRIPHPWDSPGKNTGVGCHFLLQCMKVKSEIEVVQSCPTLRNTMDCSLPGSSLHGIFQARVLEWVAIAFSDSQTILWKYLGCKILFWPFWENKTCNNVPFGHNNDLHLHAKCIRLFPKVSRSHSWD